MQVIYPYLMREKVYVGTILIKVLIDTIVERSCLGTFHLKFDTYKSLIDLQ